MTLAEYHVKQGDGTRCQWYNCACSSAAMAIWWGTGTTKLTSYQVRVKSGISCTPGVDTRSGGLRAVDVQRVAALYGVQVNYGPGGLTNWPSDELYNRLNSGYGAIVLGDAQDAPVNPSSGVVYHSAWVHGLRTGASGRETHWHDPRNSSAVWVPLSKVDRYQVSMESVRFSGFVAIADAPDTSTTPTGGTTDMAGLTLTDGASVNADIDIPAGTRYWPIRFDGGGSGTLPAVTKRAFASGYSPRLGKRLYIIGDEWAGVDVASIPPQNVHNR